MPLQTGMKPEIEFTRVCGGGYTKIDFSSPKCKSYQKKKTEENQLFLGRIFFFSWCRGINPPGGFSCPQIVFLFCIHWRSSPSDFHSWCSSFFSTNSVTYWSWQMQCFDYENFMEMNSRRPSWHCPHCNQPVCHPDIRIDLDIAKASSFGCSYTAISSLKWTPCFLFRSWERLERMLVVW